MSDSINIVLPSSRLSEGRVIVVLELSFQDSSDFGEYCTVLMIIMIFFFFFMKSPHLSTHPLQDKLP